MPQPCSDRTSEFCDTKWLRRELLNCVDATEREALFRVDERRSWWSFAHIWGALILCFLALYAMRLSPWEVKVGVSVLAVLFIGTRQNALGVRVHEGSHFLLFRNRRTNDVICNWLAAYWIASDMVSYRAVHLQHHRFLHEEGDPDREMYLLPEHGGSRAVTRFFLADLFGLTALKRVRLLLAGARAVAGPETDSRRIHLLGIGAGQGALIAAAICSFGGYWGIGYYLMFWLLPLATVYPAIIRLRTVAEHYAAELHHPSGRRFVSRTSLTDWLERYLIGADMEYHLEHHLNPAIPHYRLRALDQRLRRRGVFERLGAQTANVLNDGYFKFWKRLLAGRKDSERTWGG